MFLSRNKKNIMWIPPLICSYAHHYCIEDQKDFLELSPFASWSDAVINPQWLELSMSAINFHGAKDVQAMDVLLYILGN